MNTMQQEFDAVVTHLYTQGAPANKNGSCRYRADKMSCSVGCRIPDSMYSVDMESKNVELLLKHQADMGYQLPEEIAAYKDMFLKAQKVHDSWRVNAQSGNYELEHLDIHLKCVANEFGLTFNRPQ